MMDLYRVQARLHGHDDWIASDPVDIETAADVVALLRRNADKIEVDITLAHEYEQAAERR